MAKFHKNIPSGSKITIGPLYLKPAIPLDLFCPTQLGYHGTYE
jgi:hypothetical protein